MFHCPVIFQGILLFLICYFGIEKTSILNCIFLAFETLIVKACENGIFLLSLAVVKEMPIIVNLGVLLDLFIAVFILGLLVNRINKEFEGLEVSHLSDLKDCEYDD